MLPVVLAVAWLFTNREPQPISEPTPQSTLAAPTATPRPTATAKSAPPSDTRTFAIYLPDDDGRLQKRMVKQAGNDGLPELALKVLFTRAKDIIPPGTRLTKTISKNLNEGGGDVYFEVSLNSEFANSKMWSSEKVAELAVNSIVRTVHDAIWQETQPTYPYRVRLLINGKPGSTLGEYDISEPFE